MTWLQSVVLALAGVGAGLVGHVLRLADAGRRGIWWVLGAGFLALAVDERFALHERVRDRILAPRDVSLPLLSWIAPGDFLVLLLAVVGLALLPRVWRGLGSDRAARTALALGVVLALVAVGVDSIDPSTWTIRAERIQQTGEEIVELGSGLALLAAVGLRLLGLLDEVVVARPVDRSAPSGPVGAAGDRLIAEGSDR